MPTNQHTRRLRKALARATAMQDKHIANCRTCWGNSLPCHIAIHLAEVVSAAAIELAAARGHVRIEE